MLFEDFIQFLLLRGGGWGEQKNFKIINFEIKMDTS